MTWTLKYCRWSHATWFISGLKEYAGANPAIRFESSTTIVQSKVSDFSGPISDFEDAETADEFYDAIADDSSSEDEDSDNEIEVNKVFAFGLAM